jgi:hypothetical protein
MKTTLVDSNALLDIATDDAVWFDWSSQALGAAANESPLAINAIIYADVSIGFQRIEDLVSAIPSGLFGRDALPFEAAFLSGKRSFSTGTVAAVERLPHRFLHRFPRRR